MDGGGAVEAASCSEGADLPVDLWGKFSGATHILMPGSILGPRSRWSDRMMWCCSLGSGMGDGALARREIRRRVIWGKLRDQFWRALFDQSGGPGVVAFPHTLGSPCHVIAHLRRQGRQRWGLASWQPPARGKHQISYRTLNTTQQYR